MNEGVITRHASDGYAADALEIGRLEWGARPGATYECHLDVADGWRRLGVGRSMVQELEDLARDRGGMALYSFCAGDNAVALAFFRACGFRPSFAPDFYGVGRDAWFLWKPIGAPK